MKLLSFCVGLMTSALVFAAEGNVAPAPSTTTPSDSNYTGRHAADNHACEALVAAMKGHPCDIIFIGDSITQGWVQRGKDVWEKHYAQRNALDFGVGADATQHVLWRLEHFDIASFRPKVAVVMIGTNNTRNTPEEIAAGVKAVVAKTQQVFPGVKVILMSILPNARANEKMQAVNAIAQKFADGRTIYYLDLAAKMTPVGDSWKGLGPDKLHLTPEGYEMWAAELDPLLDQLLAAPAKA
ncbi:MAG TPA: GDSL-type esterase/lipase family protein [Opitutaceae bacterium]|nr:GDSL-type esterase/lipase family protein [Opitutaceae bacterium]